MGQRGQNFCMTQIEEEMEKDISMADIMMELGYGCSVNASQCKEILSLFLPLDKVTLSRILGTIVRTRTDLEDGQNTYSTFWSALGSSSATDSSRLSSWNANVLVDSIKQLAPQTNRTRVVENLDHEGFYFPDEEAFYLFMSIYRNACQERVASLYEDNPSIAKKDLDHDAAALILGRDNRGRVKDMTTLIFTQMS